MAQPHDGPSLMDSGQFLAALDHLDDHSPRQRGTVERADPATFDRGRPPVRHARDAREDRRNAAGRFVRQDLSDRPAQFDDPVLDEPIALGGDAPIGLVLAWLAGLIAGGGAAALVFHERLARLLFGG